MTTEYIGEAFRPIFNAAMAAWYTGNCEGVCPMGNWECKTDLSDWNTGASAKVPTFFPAIRYRFKPAPKRTVTIGYRDLDGGNEHWKTLVAPETVAPDTGATVWLLDTATPLVGFQHNACTEMWLQTGQLFLTREDAQAMADWTAKCRGGGA